MVYFLQHQTIPQKHTESAEIRKPCAEELWRSPLVQRVPKVQGETPNLSGKRTEWIIHRNWISHCFSGVAQSGQLLFDLGMEGETRSGKKDSCGKFRFKSGSR